MKTATSIVTVMAASVMLWACGINPQRTIVLDVPIKTEVLGLKLCEKSSENAIKKAIGRTTDAYILTQHQKIGTALVIRALPSTLDITYGSLSWNFIDIALNQEKKVAIISLSASYMSIDRARDQFEAACQIFTQKYGKGNIEEMSAFWTDEINRIELFYEEGSAINGEDRCFCTLRYLNQDLYETIAESNTQDV